MAGKRVKAKTKVRGMMGKLKGAARALSPSGTADVLSDYLLPKGNIASKNKGKKKMVNGRN
jgi:hypothetical protein